MTETRYARVFSYVGAFTDSDWGHASGSAWDQLEAIAAEHQRGERDWPETRKLLDQAVADVKDRRRSSTFPSERLPTSHLHDTIVSTTKGQTTMTYSPMTKAVCLGCGQVTTDPTSLEILNDLDPTCPKCGVHDVMWTLEDGTRRITQDLSEDRNGTTWFAIHPESTNSSEFKGRIRAPMDGRKLPTATLGEFRKVTRDLPDDTYLTAYDADQCWYKNLEVTTEAVDAMRPEDGQPSLILDITGDTDTRQF
jgi:hypothetical protein